MSSAGTARRARRTWTATEVDRFKPLVCAAGLFPLARWVWLAFAGRLGANPPDFLIDSSGIWALAALLAALAITPMRRLLGQPGLVRLRRMLGLFAFFYAFLHVSGWAFWDCGVSALCMRDDIVQRTFIAVGAIAFVPMIALAVTSTRGWMRRLGHRWQAVHRSVYAVGLLSVWHFWLVRVGKHDFLEPAAYGFVLLSMLLVRAFFFARTRYRSLRA